MIDALEPLIVLRPSHGILQWRASKLSTTENRALQQGSKVRENMEERLH